MLPVFELIIVFGVAGVTSIAALWWADRKGHAAISIAETSEEAAIFLFDEDTLMQATTPAMAMLALEPGLHEWADLYDTLEARFPDLPRQIYQGQSGKMSLEAVDEATPKHIQIKWQDRRCWVTLRAPSRAGFPPSDHQELLALRRSSDTTPHPIWHTQTDGKVIWRNAAYDTLMAIAGNATDGAPLFDATNLNLPARVKMQTATSERPDWYEITAVTVEDVTIFHATCITPVVEAEDAQRNFVQTLTKTFAHLSIGLAIFDRKGQLALFNPSLIDLTGLTAQFLSARPTILSFFDALRENRRMPEPKNYLNWRQELADLIAEAANGRYHETWSLESGQTYSVQGRPHPDGATAFLIEDISAEVALTRNFRAELELSQSLLDTVEQALAVFSPSGILTFCNAAYKELWGVDPDACFVDVTIADAVTLWRQQSTANPRWAEIETSVLTYGSRTTWAMPVALNSGSEITCEVVPIAAAATLVRFYPKAVNTPAELRQLMPAL